MLVRQAMNRRPRWSPVVDPVPSYINVSFIVPYLLISLVSLPEALGQHAPPNDLYTSQPADQPRRPILDLISAAVHSILHPSAYHDARHRTKRHMSGIHIVEACMIPVLVALSGMFAGLTLG